MTADAKHTLGAVLMWGGVVVSACGAIAVMPSRPAFGAALGVIAQRFASLPVSVEIDVQAREIADVLATALNVPVALEAGEDTDWHDLLRSVVVNIVGGTAHGLLDRVCEELGSYEWGTVEDGAKQMVLIWPQDASQSRLSETVDLSQTGPMTLGDLLALSSAGRGLRLMSAGEEHAGGLPIVRVHRIYEDESGQIRISNGPLDQIAGAEVDLSDLGARPLREALAIALLRMSTEPTTYECR